MYKHMRSFMLLSSMLALTIMPVNAQHVSLKNNLLYDATLTPNIGVEVMTDSHNSLQLFYGFHPWTFSNNKKLSHWSIMPEWRQWLEDKEPMEGWFWGIHLVGGEYNVGGKKLPLGIFKPLRHNRYEGWYAGGGLTLGHAWRLNDNWRLEAAVGMGYIHTRYHRYEAPICGDDLGTGHYNYVGPTKLALNLAYVMGKKKVPEPVIEVDTVVPPPPPYVPQYQLTFVTPQAEVEKARNLSGRAYLDFVVNKIDIRPDYRRNAVELATVYQTIDAVRQDSNITITHISIHGYASPEGSYQNNTRLAQGRAQAFKDYIQMLIQLPASIFSVQSTPEDWEGLISHLSPSPISPSRPISPISQIAPATLERVLAIAASTTIAPDEKERQLKRQFPREWRLMLDSIFPALRHSDYEVSYTIRPFTVEEARQLIKTKPQQLSLNEMFLVANTYQPGSQEYIDVFETAVRMYPDDETANLNAAIIALRNSDTANAARHLLKAGSSPEAENARGVMYAIMGDTDKAEEAFTRCTLPEAQHNRTEMNRQINSMR